MEDIWNIHTYIYGIYGSGTSQFPAIFWNVFAECFDFDVDDVGLREEDIGDCQKRYPP